MISGSNWMQVDGTAAEDYYPTNGYGGVSATSTANTTAGARWVKVYGLLIIKAHSSASIVSVGIDNGSDGATDLISITIAASQACPLYVPLGGNDGVNIPGPLSASTQTHTDTEFILFYNKLM